LEQLFSVYSVTKAGLNALTRSAALEFATYGILVNAVCPGYVGTELTFANNSPEQLAGIASSIPLQRLAQPDEIAKLVVFLCSQDNTYLTGQSIIIDGGFTCK
jgi:3-oxoacyl-[acyl-carrier protein] reductase